ncbi:hypothetical protein AB0L22_08590 [Micromonospora haikouensis]|uniref:hypothetical protein n=1 Tax=Micromonospora haikouensis TaxID=686309 RepID=UPI00342F460C
MARYQLDDPALQAALDDLAAEDVKDWPLSDAQLATLARLLPQRQPTAKPTRVPATQRRAA